MKMGETVTFVSTSVATIESCIREFARAPGEMGRDPTLPIAFSNGSAAVLAHEMIGHPAELSPQDGFPDWLAIWDDPAGPLVTMMNGDDGGQTHRVNLTQGEQPSAFRRATHRDVALRRMTNTLVTSTREIALPDSYIDVTILGNASVSRSTGEVRLRVITATLVGGVERIPLAPFTLESSVRRISAALIGSHGPAVIYPGVLCSEEGQRLPVGAASPGLLLSAEGFD